MALEGYGVANERCFSKIPERPRPAFAVLLKEVGMDIADFIDIASESSAGSLSIPCCLTSFSFGFKGNLRKEATEAPLIEGRIESESCESLDTREAIRIAESPTAVRTMAEELRLIAEVVGGA